MEEKNIHKPKSANPGDIIRTVLRHISSVRKSMEANQKNTFVYKDGKMEPYLGPAKYRQDIETYIVLSNGQSYRNYTWNELPEDDKHLFFKSGYFEKKENNREEWVEISSDDFFKKLR